MKTNALLPFCMVWILTVPGLECKGCIWKQKSIRVLALFDSNDKVIEKNLYEAVSERNFEASDDEQNCRPDILYTLLYLNETMTDLEIFRSLERTFEKHEHCLILFASKNKKAKYILDYAAKQRIPLVNTVSKVSQEGNQTTRSLASQYEHKLHMVQLNSFSSLQDKIAAVAPVLASLGWKKMATIFDNSVLSLQIASSIGATLSTNKLVMINSTYITQDISAGNIAEKLHTLKQDCSAFLIVSDNPGLLRTIFLAADWLGMLGQANQWVLFSNMARDDLVAEVLPYELFMVHPHRLSWGLPELVPDAIQLISQGLKGIQNFHTADHKMCSCRCECASFRIWIYRSMLQTEFGGKTGLVKFDDTGARRFGQYDISVIAISNGQLMSQTIGMWNGQTVKISSPINRPKLRVLINEYPPNIMSVDKPKNGPCPSGASVCLKRIRAKDGSETDLARCCYGFAIDVLELIKQALNFEPELRFSEDGQFGVYDEVNKTWNGIVKELLDDKGDITLDLYISARRATVLDFTEPYAPSGIRLLVKERSGKGGNIYWLSYLRPFTMNVWLTLLGSMGIMSLFLWLVEKLAPCRQESNPIKRSVNDYDKEENDQALFFETKGYVSNKYDVETIETETLTNIDEGDNSEETNKQPVAYGPFGLDNAICFTLALAFGRPADEAKPMLHGARLASVAFGVAMLMFVSTYSANLAAFLIVEDKYTTVENIYDPKIANPPEGFTYGTVKGSYMADFFANAESTYMRGMWYHMRKHNVETSKEGVRKVKSGELDVFISDHISLVYESLNDLDCELKVVGEPFAMSGASLAVKKGSPWFNALNDVLQQLKSKDLTDFIQKFWVQKFKCNNEKPPSQLQIQDLSGIFLQLSLVFVACFIGTFIRNAVEHFAHRYNNKRSMGDRRKDREEELVVSQSMLPSVVACKMTRTKSTEV